MSNPRPLSPHLQIYRLPLLALMSISHRITGLVLSLAALLLPVFLVAVASGPAAYERLNGHLAAWYGQVFLFAVSVSLAYHLLNGIRHLIWDTVHNLDVRPAEKSGYLVLVLSVVLTAAIWWFGLAQAGGGA